MPEEKTMRSQRSKQSSKDEGNGEKQRRTKKEGKLNKVREKNAIIWAGFFFHDIGGFFRSSYEDCRLQWTRRVLSSKSSLFPTTNIFILCPLTILA